MIKMMVITVVAAVALVNTAVAGQARVRVTVIDDKTEKPIANVDLCGAFVDKLDERTSLADCTSDQLASGTTDENGVCILQGPESSKAAAISLENAPRGYLPCGWHCVNLRKLWPGVVKTTIRLEPIGHRTPLGSMHIGAALGSSPTENYFEKAGGELKFDLLAGDWLPPLGTGVTADVVFTRLPHDLLSSKKSAGYQFDYYQAGVVMKFTGEGNGVRKVKYNPRSTVQIKEAPEDGYKQDSIVYKAKVSSLSGPEMDDVYCDYYAFRIRTKRDQAGKITEAYYGKIENGLAFVWQWGSGKGKDMKEACPLVRYFVNPVSLDRNLDWDCEENVFKVPAAGSRCTDRSYTL